MAGAVNADFLNAFLKPIQGRMDQLHDENESKRKERVQGYWKIIQDSQSFPDATVQEAWKGLNKDSAPEAKKGITQLQGLFHKHSPPSQGGQPGQPGQGGQGGGVPQPGAQPNPAGGGPPTTGPFAGGGPLPYAEQQKRLQAEQTAKDQSASDVREGEYEKKSNFDIGQQSEMLKRIDADSKLSDDEKHQARMQVYGVKPEPQSKAEVQNIPAASLEGKTDKFGNKIDPQSSTTYTLTTNGELIPSNKPLTKSQEDKSLAIQAYKQRHGVQGELSPVDIQKAISEQKESETATSITELRDLSKGIQKQKMDDALKNGKGLAPESLDFWAEAVRAGVPLPAMGMGPSAVAMKVAIMNRAAEKATSAGDTGTAYALQKIAYNAGTRAIGATESQRAVVDSYERNVSLGLDLLQEYSQRVDRTGSPLANKYLLYLQGKVGGDDDTILLENQANIVANEFARVMTTTGGGGVTSDAARKEAQGMLNAGFSKGNITSVIGQMKKDMANRITGYNKGIEEEAQRAVQGTNSPLQAPGKTTPPTPAKELPVKVYDEKTGKFIDKPTSNKGGGQ